MTALSEFEDSQAAFYLLRVSYSIVRAVHFVRVTTPLEPLAGQRQELRQADAQGRWRPYPRHSPCPNTRTNSLASPRKLGGMEKNFSGFDEKAHRELVRKFDQAKNPRDSRRLLRCAQPHASGFVTAVPSKEDGNNGAIMSPHHFRTAVMLYRLGIPLLTDENPFAPFVHAAHLP